MSHSPRPAPLLVLFTLLVASTSPAGSEPIRITGRIEPAGAAGARVELRVWPGGSAAVSATRPGADGTFVLTAAESGFYRVIAAADGSPEMEHLLTPLVDEVELAPVRLGGVLVTPGDPDRFPRWGALRERTVSAPAAPLRSGFVVDAVTRKPIGGALVWQSFGEVFSWTRTGADGSFRLAAEAARPLAAVAPGYARAVRPEVPPEAPASLALKPAVGLEGIVVDREGRPLAGAEVRVVVADPYPYDRGLRDLVRGFTDANGAFRLRGVPARSLLQVQATAAGYARAEQMATTGEPGERPGRVQLSLGAGFSVVGRLLAAEMRPIPVTEVVLEDYAATDAGLAAGPEIRSARTDAAGRFRFEHLPVGSHHLRAGSAFLKTIEIAAGPAEDLDIGDVTWRPVAKDPETARVDAVSTALSSWLETSPEPALPGLPVAGKVVDPQGAAVPGAQLVLHAPTAGRLLRTAGAADGTFRFPSVPEGSYRLVARAAGFGDSAVTEVQRAGSAIEGLELRLQPGGTVAGRILGLAEHELPRVQVSAWREGVETLLPLRALTGTDGRYRIIGLPLGDWRITARRASSYLVEKTVRLTAPGEELALDLAFPEGAAVTGLVLLDDKPLAGALVSLGNAETDGRQVRQTTTRADGSFVISAVEPGTWRLLVLTESVRHVLPVEVPQHGSLLLSLTGGSPP